MSSHTQIRRRPNKPPNRRELVIDALQQVSAPDRLAYVDRARGWCIQVFHDKTPGCDGTPWEGTLRVSIKHTRATNHDDFFKRGFGIPITWDQLQSIKDHFWPDQIAVEVYPPHDKIVDVAEMRWLWVLPAGAVLPFNLTGERTLA